VIMVNKDIMTNELVEIIFVAIIIINFTHAKLLNVNWSILGL